MAEAWRNLTAVGASPLALTDNLNFGNPERPEIMGQLVGCIRGIGEAARALDFPIVSGNVSLYNETNGNAILPTPTIGGVGLIDQFTKSMTIAFKAGGEAILLIGDTRGWLGQSLYLRDVCGREEGAPPPVDLAAEKRNGDFIRSLIRDGLATAVHDVSDGGAAGRARRNGDRVRHRRRTRSAVEPSVARLLVRRRSGTLRRYYAEHRRCRAKGGGRRQCRCGGSARPAAARWRSAASGRCRSPISNESFEAWLPNYIAGTAA